MKLRALILALLLSASITTPTRADVLTSDTTMVLVKTINGTITPKSVRASSDGTVSAHNMMYRHSVTLYDANTMELKATIPDKVDLNALGFPQYSGSYQGAPVEGAYSPDGKYIYVTNYAMYGKGFNHEGHDDCKATNPYDRSFLYRINRESNAIDAAYLVGKVPKVVQVSPDNKWILVSNWCSYDLSVISVESQKVVKTIKIGAYPRGIVIKKDSSLAFVAQMGGTTIHEINLASFAHRTLTIGVNPRALVLSPDENTIYATLNLSGKVVAYDFTKKKVIHSITTGKTSRSLDISTDGSALFVVNFDSDTVSKIRTSDFVILQSIKVCNEPIGITYEPTMNRTWVACYKGQIKIFDNK